jgi:hypothetical protein
MWIFATLGSLLLIILVLMDGFESMVLPRQVTRRWRFTRLFYLATWRCWRFLALCLPMGRWRAAFLSRFGPFSMLVLFATWTSGLVIGFALLHLSLETEFHSPEEKVTFGTHLYLSGATFFTLGYGDVYPVTPLGRFLAVAEAGIGFGFMALIIGYLPVLYQAFSRREVPISLLDARGGSPPSAGQFLLRLSRSGNFAAVDTFLAEWERWAGELLESHLSFPVLSFYRSQHDNQSWLGGLTAMLDTCTVLLLGVKGHNPYQAQVTFAMARHAVVDLALVFYTQPLDNEPDRLPAGQLERLREDLRQAGLDLRTGVGVDDKLADLRRMYEPFVNALARHFLFPLPPIVPEETPADNWQRSRWLPRAPELGGLSAAPAADDHFG